MHDEIITYILTFSSDTRHIGSEELYNQVGKKHAVSAKSFQRSITNAVKEYQEEQINKAERGEKFNLIMSMGDGYFVPGNVQSACQCLSFLEDRAYKILDRKNRLEKIIIKKFKVRTETVNENQLSFL